MHKTIREAFENKMLLLVIIQYLVFGIVNSQQSPSSTSNPNLQENTDADCHYRSEVSVSLKRNNGVFQKLDKIPYEVICSAVDGVCTYHNGVLEPAEDSLKHMNLTGVGWYGKWSAHKNDFGLVVPFYTKINHSDPFEEAVIHGCSGTLHPDHIPDEPWIALIERGQCKFSIKIENAALAKAKAVIVFNSGVGDLVTMDHGAKDMVTVMINASVGKNLEILHDLVGRLSNKPNETYAGVYVNVSFVEKRCEAKNVPQKQLSVTIVAVVFVVMMIIALAWLVTYYIQRHRNNNKHRALKERLQKAAKKALKRLGERVITSEEEDQECTYCLEALIRGDIIRELPCKHKFHRECVDEWLIMNRTCPNCKDDLLLAMGVTVRGVNLNNVQVEIEHTAVEMQEMMPEHSQLISDSQNQMQALSGDSYAGDSQYFGSQKIPGSQLLTDGQNMFLYVPNDVPINLDTTIQIDGPLPTTSSMCSAPPDEVEKELTDEYNQLILTDNLPSSISRR